MSYYLALNGTQVKAPASLEVVIQDIDSKASRDANGLLHRDRVAVKRKLTAKWGYLTVSQCSTILSAISSQFFTATYMDPQEGSLVTKTFYTGDRTMPFYTFNTDLSKYVWQNLSADFIEQ
jgi:hypothetical protein